MSTKVDLYLWHVFRNLLFLLFLFFSPFVGAYLQNFSDNFFTLINASANKCIENIDRLIGLADNKWICWITTHMDFKVNITHFTCVLTSNASLYIKSFTNNILNWYLYETTTKQSKIPYFHINIIYIVNVKTDTSWILRCEMLFWSFFSKMLWVKKITFCESSFNRVIADDFSKTLQHMGLDVMKLNILLVVSNNALKMFYIVILEHQQTYLENCVCCLLQTWELTL